MPLSFYRHTPINLYASYITQSLTIGLLTLRTLQLRKYAASAISLYEESYQILSKLISSRNIIKELNFVAFIVR